MINAIKNFTGYIPLLSELVSRDLKVKYRRSILGYMWSLLNPLLMALVVSAVFSFVFKNSIDNYPIYLIIGQIFFNFFSEATTGAMTTLIDNKGLLQKVYIPKYILPLAKVCSTLVHIFYSMLAVIIVLVFTHTPVSFTIILFPVGLLYILLFCVGVSLILSVVSVYFRDTIHLYGVLITVWLYLTPVFYSIDMLSPQMRGLISLNPMYHFINYFRQIIIWGQIPSLAENAICLLSGVVVVLMGASFFRKHQDRLVIYL